MDRIDEIVATISKGGVVLLPTDTVYGLLADPKSEKGIALIFEAKARPLSQNLPFLFSSIGQLEVMGLDINVQAKKLLSSPLVPGALSLVLGFSDTRRLGWLSGREEVAVRMPDDERLLKILARSGPLLATSANLHGSSPMPTAVPDILLELAVPPSLVIDEGQIGEIPSSIVNCRSHPAVIERVGAIPAKDIFEVLNG